MKIEWKDISTAPKDGERILISNGYDVYIASWGGSSDMDTFKSWVISVNGDSGFNYYDCVYDATHWCELPKLP